MPWSRLPTARFPKPTWPRWAAAAGPRSTDGTKNVTAATTVNLTSTSAAGKFDTSATGLFNGTVTSVSIAAGANSASFYYKDTTAGTPTITAARATIACRLNRVANTARPMAPPICRTSELRPVASVSLWRGMVDRARERALQFKHILGPENFYLEIQENGLPEQTEANKKLMEIADVNAKGRVVSLLEGGYDLQGLSRSVAAHVTALMRG